MNGDTNKEKNNNDKNHKKDESNFEEESKVEDEINKDSTAKDDPNTLSKEESEKLLKVFQQEYDKNKEEAETETENAEQTIDDAEEEVLDAPLLSGDELCVFCGVNPKDNDEFETSDACVSCREKLLKYPLPVKSFIAYFVVILAFILGLLQFIVIFPSSVQIAYADSLERKSNLKGASEIYFQLSESQMYSNDFERKFFIEPLRLTRKSIEMLEAFGQPNSIPSVYESLPEYAKHLPKYRKLEKIKDGAEAFVESLQESYAIIGSSMQLNGDDFPYDEIVLSLDELLLSNETKENKEHRKAAVLYYKYTAALLADKGLDAQIAPLEEIENLLPDSLWLYARYLGYANARAKNFDDAFAIAEKIKEQDLNDGYSYVIEATIYRMQKDFEKSIKVCDEGLEKDVENYAEIARQKAISLLLDSKAKEALDSFKDIAEENQTLQNYYTLAVCALEAKDTNTYKEINELFESINEQQGIDSEDPQALKMGKGVLEYKNNKISLEEMFLLGLADVF